MENFLRMTFGFPAEPYEVDPTIARALDMLLILHADHEQNCSTSTVRLVGSSHANLFASVSAGINALFGPLHGGANQAVLEMLQKIQREGGDVEAFVKRVKNKEDGVEADGLRPPRLQELRPARGDRQDSAPTRSSSGWAVNDPLLDIAMELEEKALADDYFIERKLYPNVDFYTGLIYRAMGFPTRMFTVLFAIGRLPGWIAHWREMINDPDHEDRPSAAALRRPGGAQLPRARITVFWHSFPLTTGARGRGPARSAPRPAPPGGQPAASCA